MSFSPAFTCAQSTAAPSTVVFTDTSTGTDGSIDSRRIYVTDYAGNYIVPTGTSTSYISWPLATNPITVQNLLTQDTACNVLVQWLDSGGNVLYESDEDFPFVATNQQFYFYLIQQLALSPTTLQDTTFASNLALYWTYIIGAINAISYGDSISASQNMINLANNMMNNQNYYF